jgi:hypothetical protein
LRLGEVGLPPAGLAAGVRWRLPDRAEAAVFVAAVDVGAEAVRSEADYSVAPPSIATSAPVT